MKNTILAILIALACQPFAYGSNAEIDSALKNAETFNKQRQYQKAIAEYDKAFSIDPKLFDKYVERATAYTNLKEYTAALTDVNAALAQDYTNFDAYALRSKIYVQLGKKKEATADRQQCKKWMQEYSQCMNRIQSKIRANWHPPLLTGKKVTIAFMKVKADGTITSVTLPTQSGEKDFDQSCLDALTLASPLPSLPASDVPDADIQFTFKYRGFGSISNNPNKHDLGIINAHQRASKLASFKTILDKQGSAPTSLESAQIMIDMADIFAEQKQYADAEKHYQQALEIHKRNTSADNAAVIDITVKLADCYQSQKAYDKAEPLYKDAIANLEKAKPAKTSDLAHALQGYGKLLHKTKRRAEGCAMYKESIRLKAQKP